MKISDITGLRFNWSDVKELRLNANVVWQAQSRVLGWTALAQMPESCQNATAATVGDRLYIIAGRRNMTDTTLTAANYVYNPTTNTYSTITKIPTSVFNISQNSPSIGSSIYVVGGTTVSESPIYYPQIYNTATNTWSTGQSIGGITNCTGTTVTLDGKVYHINGNGNNSGVYYHRRYDPSTNSWSTMTQSPSPRYNAIGVVFDGAIYLMCGGNGQTWTPTASAFRYNIVGNSWTTLPSPRISRHDLIGATVFIEGVRRVVITAGRLSDGTPTNITEYFNGNSWVLSPDLDMPVKIGIPCVSEYNNAMYVFGGFNGSNQQQLPYVLK